MKTFVKTISVQAVKVIDTTGSLIIVGDEKDPETIDLGNEFATRNNYKPGDYVIFENGHPSGYMKASLFEAEYKEYVPPKPKRKSKKS